MKGIFSFKKLIKDIGFYAHIEITVTRKNEKTIELIYEDSADYYSALMFGADYFFEQYDWVKKGGLTVEVNYLHTMIVDSSSIVVVYVLIQAMCDALDLNGVEIIIDDKGRLILPKHTNNL